MSDDLVERLAKAIVQADEQNGGPPWDSVCLAEIEAAGYAVVPVEPTAEMEAAGNEPLNWVMTSAGTVWRAMLSASRKEST